ncbi:hypothetical protein [Rubellimicrobium roseum]|uniref:Uncharacterized protein n=1 Tax=Rubellimicrobium roseum TaxID=687525 RepID=A0A5C4N7L0_9RHOB|nr:hypothetical protein [Rubellimicrobium roseum]TNC66568.1 hypothetical protein FHG71_16410 [Rubellimicrobium roseum]
MRPAYKRSLVPALLDLALLSGPVWAQEAMTADLATDGTTENNGTYPTGPVRSVTLAFENSEAGT